MPHFRSGVAVRWHDRLGLAVATNLRDQRPTDAFAVAVAVKVDQAIGLAIVQTLDGAVQPLFGNAVRHTGQRIVDVVSPRTKEGGAG